MSYIPHAFDSYVGLSQNGELLFKATELSHVKDEVQKHLVKTGEKFAEIYFGRILIETVTN